MEKRRYLASTAVVLAATAVCGALFRHFDSSSLIMIYLLGVAFVASRLGRGPSILAAALSVALFDFFFVAPHLTFAVADTQYIVTFAVMLAVGLLISTLAIRARDEAVAARDARLAMENERLRSTLLSSVSHDFRTPLSAITGAVTCLIEDEALPAAARRDLEETIREEADRLNRLVTNLLDMTRLESGTLHLRRDWHSVEEVVGTALSRLEGRLGQRPVVTAIEPELPLVRIDAALVEQLLVNLLENALKYAPHPAAIRITAGREAGDVVITVADEGPGLPAGEEEKVFEKFYRSGGDTQRGFGLGLPICRAIATAHGGRIWAVKGVPGGAALRFTLGPQDVAPPNPIEGGVSDSSH